jgi:hypothetical protein
MKLVTHENEICGGQERQELGVMIGLIGQIDRSCVSVNPTIVMLVGFASIRILGSFERRDLSFRKWWES